MTKVLLTLTAPFLLNYMVVSQTQIHLRSASKLKSSTVDIDIGGADAAIPSGGTGATDASSASGSSPSLTAEAEADRITDLPSLAFEPNFDQFSGYLDVSPTRQIHYWYIESMNDPSTDPVVFWTNGGPGCSGLLGLGTEMGPYIFNEDGSLSLNEFTWNKVANMLYVEQPAGVGFSTYSDDKDRYVGDDRAAQDNYSLIQEFMKRFPHRQSNEFYIASESFGGHYIPHLAKTILDQNTDNSLNFRGFLVGNPYVDPFSNDITMIRTYYMHGLIAHPLYSPWEQHCTKPETYERNKCSDLTNLMMKDAGDGINPYALDYPACTEPDSDDYPPKEEQQHQSSSTTNAASATATATAAVGVFESMPASSQSRRRTNAMGMVSQASRLINTTSGQSPPFLPTEDVYHPCAATHFVNFLNRDDVRKALHVEKAFGDEEGWSMCSDKINYSPSDTEKPQMYLYEELIKRGRKAGSDLKMMVFSGDDDSVCSTASTQYWIYNVGAEPKKDKLWNPWKFENQTAGFITDFDLGSADDSSSFTFVTVHGAGHEVPAYRPAEALSMFKSYLSGEWET